MKHLKFLLVLLAVIGTIFSISLFDAQSLYASPADDVCEGIGGTADEDAGCSVGGEGDPSVESTLSVVVNILSVVVGVVAVIMIIWGGFRYVTAAGDAGKAASARQTIIYAIVGIIIVALAQFIVQFVIEGVTSPEAEEDATLLIATTVTNLL